MSTKTPAPPAKIPPQPCQHDYRPAYEENGSRYYLCAHCYRQKRQVLAGSDK